MQTSFLVEGLLGQQGGSMGEGQDGGQTGAAPQKRQREGVEAGEKCGGVY